MCDIVDSGCAPRLLSYDRNLEPISYILFLSIAWFLRICFKPAPVSRRHLEHFPQLSGDTVLTLTSVIH